MGKNAKSKRVPKAPISGSTESHHDKMVTRLVKEPASVVHGLPRRANARVRRAFAKVNEILERDFAVMNAAVLKTYILNNDVQVTSDTLEKMFQGRNHFRFQPVLVLVADYLEDLAATTLPFSRPLEGYLRELCAARDGIQFPSTSTSTSRSSEAPIFAIHVRRDALPAPVVAASALGMPTDLWTPGITAAQITHSYGAHMEPEGAAQLAELSRRAVEAIAQGNFAEQLAIAEQALIIGTSFASPVTRGEALYLKGEASRLLADFESNRSESRRLRDVAMRVYEESVELLKSDPRPIRGRARTIEVLGDLDTAFDQFCLSTALAERQATDVSERDHHSNAHERVRSLRHKLNCLAAIHSDTLQGTQYAMVRQNELRILLEESERRHRDTLKLFEFSGDWWRIEWFMAEVLHAKGWASIRESARASKRLESALAQRLSMLSDAGALSPVELGNFRWWVATAMPIKSAFELGQESSLDQFSALLTTGATRQTVKALGWDFLRRSMPAWMP